MKKVLIIVFVLLIFICLKNDYSKYHLKIEIKTTHLSPLEVDNFISKNVSEIILNFSNVKEVVSFSSIYGCNFYCKFKPFLKSDIGLIMNKINLFLKDEENISSISFDENYHKNFKYIVFTIDNNDYFELKRKVDLFLVDLLKERKNLVFNVLGLQKKANYIYFSASDLVKFNANIEDISNMVINNNLEANLAIRKDILSDNKILINSSLNSIEDLKNIRINYPNSPLGVKFDEVFRIEKGVIEPISGEIFYENKNALIVAVSNLNIFQEFFIKNQFRDFDFEIINPKAKKRYELYFGNDFGFENLKKVYFEILNENKIKNTLAFIGKSPYGDCVFDEINFNKIVLYSSKNLSKILKKNNISVLKNRKVEFSKKVNIKNLSNKVIYAPLMSNFLDYNINEDKLIKFKLSKKDAFNSILAHSQGLNLGYYTNHGDKVYIVLKNIDLNNNFYSKEYQNLINFKEIVDIDILDDYSFLARKNNEHIYIIKSKNPSY